MMQKPWFKVFIWFMATAFFFLAFGIIFSYVRVGPSESEIMQFMSGMMKAMESSLMGLSMTLESDADLQQLVVSSAAMTLPLIVIGTVTGIYFRLRRKEDAKQK